LRSRIAFRRASSSFTQEAPGTGDGAGAAAPCGGGMRGCGAKPPSGTGALGGWSRGLAAGPASTGGTGPGGGPSRTPRVSRRSRASGLPGRGCAPFVVAPGFGRAGNPAGRACGGGDCFPRPSSPPATWIAVRNMPMYSRTACAACRRWAADWFLEANFSRNGSRVASSAGGRPYLAQKSR